MLKISKLCLRGLTQNQKINIVDTVLWSCCSTRLLCSIHCFTISIRDSVSQFYSGAQTIKGKVPHTY